MSFRRTSALAALIAAALAAGCVSGGGGSEPPASPTPTATASPTPGAGGPEGRSGATSPAIAFGAGGALRAVWIQGGEVFTALRAADGTWSADTVLDAAAHASAPVLAPAGEGAIAAWSGGADGIFAARFDGSAWSPAVRVSAADLGPAGRPDLAVDATGRAVLVWWQRSVAGTSAAPYAADGDGATWTAAAALDAGAPAVDDARLAIGASGDGAAVWRAWDGARVTVRTAARSAGHWSTASRLDASGSEPYFPSIAVGADGMPLAAWSQGSAIRAARYDGAWSAPTVISDSSSAVSPAVAADGTVVWQQGLADGETELVSRSLSGGTWSSPAVIATARALSPRVSGSAIAWRDAGGGFWLSAGGAPAVRLGGPSMATEMALVTSGTRAAVAWRDAGGLHVAVR